MLRKRPKGRKGRARPPSMDPDPFKPMEIRKTLVLEALRSQGGMTRQGILEYLQWHPKQLIVAGGTVLQLLMLEGKISRSGTGKYAMYFADPDITEQMITPKEEK